MPLQLLVCIFNAEECNMPIAGGMAKRYGVLGVLGVLGELSGLSCAPGIA